MTPERIAELRRQLAVEVSLAAAGAKHPSFDIYAALADTLDALDAAERRAEELIRQRDATRAKNTELNRRAQVADAAVRDQIAHGSGGRSLGRALANVAVAMWKERYEAAEAENLRLREALDVIATCPAEAVHLMPLAAQAALAGEVPRGDG